MAAEADIIDLTEGTPGPRVELGVDQAQGAPSSESLDVSEQFALANVGAAHPSRTDEVIDVAGVARLMNVGRNTVYAMVGRNQIPHRRLGKQIRFHREAVMRWLASWSSQGAKEGQ